MMPLHWVRSPVWRRLAGCLAAAALLGGAALIAGCGASTTLDPVARAAQVSSSQTGIDFTLEVKLGSAALAKELSITAHGWVDERKHAARMSMDFAGVPAISALPGGGTGVEAVFLYPRLYMRLPFLADKLPEGKSWMELDMSRLASTSSEGTVPQAFSIGQANPTQFLAYLRASSGEVKRLGPRQIDGVPTTGYRAELQLSRVLGSLPLGERATARSMFSHLSHAGASGAAPIDVWIDRQQRVRRIRMSLDLAGKTVSGPATIAIDFNSYGSVPTISPPKQSEVIDLTSTVASMGAAAQLGKAGL